MPTPTWLPDLLWWKQPTAKSRSACQRLFGDEAAPNLADLGSVASLQLAGVAYDALTIPRGDVRAEDPEAGGASSGAALERAVEVDLRDRLPGRDPDRSWLVSRGGSVASFAQYTHLDDLQQILSENPTLRATFAGDYQVQTDVYVGVENSTDPRDVPFLHAAISSKWTIRSDRVQNVRHEFATLVRNRRGRSPHLAVVTAEPLPSRLLSIARGTGEVDAVYHLLYDELEHAVDEVCDREGHYPEQQDAWSEMIEQRRLRPYSSLVDDLILS